MRIEIDQSGRVEETNRITAVAFSNHHQGALILTVADKKKLHQTFEKKGRRKMFGIKVFTALLYLLIRKYIKSDLEIIIDHEYPGHEPLIKDIILQQSKQDGLKIDKRLIHFHSIGKKSPAHRIAWNTFKKKQKVTKADLNQIKKILGL